MKLTVDGHEVFGRVEKREGAPILFVTGQPVPPVEALYFRFVIVQAADYELQALRAGGYDITVRPRATQRRQERRLSV